MQKFIKRWSLITLLVGIFTVSVGQSYNTSVGFRFGWNSGLSGKYFFSDKIAGEAIFSFRPNIGNYGGVYMGGLGEYHINLSDLARGAYVFGGVGAHFSIGRYSGDCYSSRRGYYTCNSRGYMGVGFDAIIGAEYKLPDIPLTIGGDFKPYFEIPFTTYEDTFPYIFGDVGITIRYVIN